MWAVEFLGLFRVYLDVIFETSSGVLFGTYNIIHATTIQRETPKKTQVLDKGIEPMDKSEPYKVKQAYDKV